MDLIVKLVFGERLPTFAYKMAPLETVALGRSKRSTAGNRLVSLTARLPVYSCLALSMRELLDKAHQEEDDFFAEAEDDEEFEAPREQCLYRHSEDS